MSSKFKVMGALYGYPDCCVESFENGFGKGADREKRKLWGTGYIPCKKCNKKTEEELIEYINKHRLIKENFPSSRSMVKFDNLFLQYQGVI